MSSASAIAAVTATMRLLLQKGIEQISGLNSINVTTLPMDRVRERNNTGSNQLNLFLYQILPNAAWRNMDVPGQVGRFETATPPLALNLYYLVTAYGEDDDSTTPNSHLLLGQAMSVLHDHPLLGRDEIQNALTGNDLYLQLERVRFTLQPLSVEEIFKLWSGFQTQYRLSAAYEAAVVLIDSTQPTRTPLPVLTRGKGDVGVLAQPGMTSPFPSIDGISLASGESVATPGDTLTITGNRLSGDEVTVVFTHPRLAKPVTATPNAGGSASSLKVALSTDAETWLAGLWAVSVTVTTDAGTPDERERTTNAWPLPFAPAITSTFPINGKLDNGAVTLKVKCKPGVSVEQRASLLLADQEFVAEPRKQISATLSFSLRAVSAGQYLVRLRVDGVDSLIVDRSKQPPEFRQQTVVLK